MTDVTLSGKNQIVVPREAREALGLKSGDKLLVVVRGDTLIIRQRPKSFAKAIHGLVRGVYPAGYLEQERREWSKRS